MTVWINTLFDTLPGEAGRPMRYWLLGRALVETGHTVVIWSGDFHHVTKCPRQVGADSVAEGIRVRLVPVLPYHRNVCWRRWRSHDGYVTAWGDAALAAVERGELAQPDVLVLAVPPPGLFDAAERLRRRWGCRVVVDIQDVWPETFYRLLPPGFRWLGPILLGSMRRAARRAYRGADAVSAVAERYAELARDGRSSERSSKVLKCESFGVESSGNSSKVLKCGSSEVDANGDGTDNFSTLALQHFRTSLVAVFPLGRLLRSSERSSKVLKCGSSEVDECGDGTNNFSTLALQHFRTSSLRLCYAGNLGETYDVGTVLEGVRRLADEGVAVSLVVAGDGPQRGRVARAAEEVPQVIRYAGYLAGDALDALLDACDVGLVPMVASSWVAVPNKLVDYAAAGLAVVNGLSGEAQVLLERYQAGIAYRPGDVQSFMVAVRRYADDAELLAWHRQGARRLAEERFDAEQIYREMAVFVTTQWSQKRG